MSWIKDNTFLVGLGGATLAGAVGLGFFAFKGLSRYDAAQASYESALSDAQSSEQTPLYPNDTNRDGKIKALGEYRQAVNALQASFEPYRPKELKNISPPDFSNLLKASSDEVTKAFDAASVKYPAGFFCGFDEYKTKPVDGGTTGLLSLQLQSVKALMHEIAKSGVSELKNLHRPSLPEEKGQTFAPNPTDVARALPLEITFTARESAVRKFFSSLSASGQPYLVIRSIRIQNTKKEPPRASDAKLDPPAAANAATPSAPAGGFVFPGDATSSAPAADTPPEEKANDASRIAGQVLGSEELNVFMRIDLMLFQPAKSLP
jgi:hypothetical protein